MADALAWINQMLSGLIQGFTEIFPVSSSGHTTIFQVLWQSFTDDRTVSFSNLIFYHLGTFLIILVVFRDDVFLLWRSFLLTLVQSPHQWNGGMNKEHPLSQRTPFYIVLSLMVTAALGLLLRQSAGDVFDKPVWVTGFLVLNGLILVLFAQYAQQRSNLGYTLSDLNEWHYVAFGIAQGIGVIPGLSRFGLVLIMGLVFGLGWHQAVRLAFLLFMPMVLGAGALELFHLQSSLVPIDLLPTVLGIVCSAIGTWLAIRMIRRDDLLVHQALSYFGTYCLTVGTFFFLYIVFL